MIEILISVGVVIRRFFLQVWGINCYRCSDGCHGVLGSDGYRDLCVCLATLQQGRPKETRKRPWPNMQRCYIVRRYLGFFIFLFIIMSIS